MIFDEWERKYLARRKEYEAWASSAKDAEKDNTTGAPTGPAEKARGATASTGGLLWEYLPLAPNLYLVRSYDDVWVMDQKSLIQLMRVRHGAWRIGS